MQLDDSKGFYIPTIHKEACNDCGICVIVCPGKNVDYTRMNQSYLGSELHDILMGTYLGAFRGYSTEHNIRYHSSSGGLITSLLVSALEEKLIDGVLVTKMSQEIPLHAEPFIARTRQEVISATKSKYCPVPVNIRLKEILEEPGRFAVVGLPCHIQGIRKAEEHSPILKEKILFHLGLLCSHTDNFHMTEFILNMYGIKPKDISTLDYRGDGWPGTMNITLKDGKKFHSPFISHSIIHDSDLFTLPRCLTCCDIAAKFADISFGDPWHIDIDDKIGTTVAIARNEKGAELLNRAKARGNVYLGKLSGDQIQKWRLSSFRLKRTAAAISIKKLLRKQIPDYNIQLYSPGPAGYTAVAVFYCASFLGKQRWLWWLLTQTIPLMRWFLKGVNKVVASTLRK
jgi:coenzyme F420 hydrogenase subunit beta